MSAWYFIQIFRVPSWFNFASGTFWGLSDRIIPLSVSSGKLDSGKPFFISDGSMRSFERIWHFFIFGIL
jgi:hypothetical protein